MKIQGPIIPIERLGTPELPSPLPLANEPGRGRSRFVPEDARVRERVEVAPGLADDPGGDLLFEKAGPRERLFFDPSSTRAAVVTCGGLCPGLNSVIRSLFMELRFNYGVPEILGIRFGFRGLVAGAGPPPIRLSREFVTSIHKEGGTMLGSSRGPRDVGAMVDFLESERVDMLFCVGGDGTQRGALAIVEEVARRGRPIAVVGIPKTIDNDLLHCSRTFGYVTAVDHARHVVHLAHNEAKGAARGIGLVKVMGRDSGFIACGATLACQEVNFALIPEVPFRLDGDDGLLAALERRMDERDHAVIVVAEGAGQHLFPGSTDERDASGNRRYHDIGPFLRQRIVDHFRDRGAPVELKYIDPSYIIRSAPANTDDSILCDRLARHAAHAALAGRTGLVVAQLNGAYVHVPIPEAVASKRRVDPEGELWGSVLAVTGQPARLGG